MKKIISEHLYKLTVVERTGFTEYLLNFLSHGGKIILQKTYEKNEQNVHIQLVAIRSVCELHSRLQKIGFLVYFFLIVCFIDGLLIIL
jgi:hypothetical protein